MEKVIIKQVVKYEWTCLKCGFKNSNRVYDYNECKNCNKTINDLEIIDVG